MWDEDYMVAMLGELEEVIDQYRYLGGIDG